jgi:hypothetical protein
MGLTAEPPRTNEKTRQIAVLRSGGPPYGSDALSGNKRVELS